MSRPVVVITGTSRGIGRYLADYYARQGNVVIGCSRQAVEDRPVDDRLENYQHFCLDVSDESEVKKLFSEVRRQHGRLDGLINNAGVASMNHALLTPGETVDTIFRTNYLGTFLFCREAARLMRKAKFGRIVNFATVATPLRLEGESVYASSKAAVISLTQILGKELADFGITVNAIGPTPIRTDLVRGVPEAKLDELIERQSIKRMGTFEDVSNVIDFFFRRESDFITGQTIFLGGVS